jgi:polysaccharide export outer membrane protein
MIDKSDFDVSINYSRVITINVVGDVENPGSYTFPAINTAYNILAYVGGPSKVRFYQRHSN